jgi:putative Holliday junction resolvase
MSDEVLMGIDYGEKNTGVAFGRDGSVAPMTILDSKNTFQLISDISRYIAENKVTKIVVGLPLSPEGKETPQSLKVRRFINMLKIKIKKPVEYVSEDGTTKEAILGAIKSGISKKRRRTNDSLSAALILKRYYNQQE